MPVRGADNSSQYTERSSYGNYQEMETPSSSSRAEGRRRMEEPERTPEQIERAAKEALEKAVEAGIAAAVGTLASRGPDALARTLSQGSALDKICHIVGKVLAELGKLAFLVGLGAFMAGAAGLFVMAVPDLALQLAIGGGMSLLGGEIIKNIASKPAPDTVMNHTFSF